MLIQPHTADIEIRWLIISGAKDSIWIYTSIKRLKKRVVPEAAVVVAEAQVAVDTMVVAA